MFHNDPSQLLQLPKTFVTFRDSQRLAFLLTHSPALIGSLQAYDIVLCPFRWKLESFVVAGKVTGSGVHSPYL